MWSHRTEGKPFGKEKGGSLEIRQKAPPPPFSSPTGCPLRLPFPSPLFFPLLRFFWGCSGKGACSAFTRLIHAVGSVYLYRVPARKKPRTCRCCIKGGSNPLFLCFFLFSAPNRDIQEVPPYLFLSPGGRGEAPNPSTVTLPLPAARGLGAEPQSKNSRAIHVCPSVPPFPFYPHRQVRGFLRAGPL